MTIYYEPYHPHKETLQIIGYVRKFAKAENPVTVRQCFYYLVSTNVLKNTEEEYGRLCRFLVRARKAGFIPFEWIEDRSRRALIIPVYSSIQEFIEEMAKGYWKDTWENQPYLIIIILEKEALTSIVWDVASYFNVPVFPTRGYVSWSILYEKFRKLVNKYLDKPLVVIMLGDYDPSGKDIQEDCVKKLEFLGCSPDIVEKVALTKEQVEKFQLPPQPAKKKDPRYEKFSKQYGEYAVELDALKPSQLKEIVGDAILKYLNAEAFVKDQEIEKKQRERLKEMTEDIKDIGVDG